MNTQTEKGENHFNLIKFSNKKTHPLDDDDVYNVRYIAAR